MFNWLLFITSLPTENATVRMRAWRALKASGAAVLRDGVYLLPAREACAAMLETLATEVQSAAGSALVLRVEAPPGADFAQRFDRGADYAALRAEIATARDALNADAAAETLKQSRKLRKTLAGLSDIDFFPGPARQQTEAALADLEQAVARALVPDEPQPVAAPIQRRERLDIAAHRGRTWATRRRPRVDRLASAWLIRRYIDPAARLRWLASPADCPADALGFDFDGAAFTHVGGRVTFEVLLASFGLETPALLRLGALVHYLDVGGVAPAEAGGIEQVLAGLQTTIADDDQLLTTASSVFDALLASFEKTNP